MALWRVVDGAGDVVWVTWHADSVVVGGRCRLGDVARVDRVGGGGRRQRRCLGDVARAWRCGGWWKASATSFR